MIEDVQWKRTIGRRLMNYAYSTMVGVDVYCRAACNQQADCDSFNFRPSDNTCELNSYPNGTDSNNVNIVSDWNWCNPIIYN